MLYLKCKEEAAGRKQGVNLKGSNFLLLKRRKRGLLMLLLLLLMLLLLLGRLENSFRVSLLPVSNLNHSENFYRMEMS